MWLSLVLACGPPPVEPPPEPASVAAPVPLEGREPPRGRPETHQAMVDDLAAERSPSDGGGGLSLVDGPTELQAGAPGRWELRYRAGPLGIAVGGSLIFQAPPFWGWDPPQNERPGAPGYTAVSARPDGVRLTTRVLEQGMLRIGVEGRGLVEGEEVRLVYSGRADRYAESESEFWLGVDGDGDGIRRLVSEPVRVAVVAREPVRLVVTLPSVAEPGGPANIRVAALDARGNRTSAEGTVRLEATGPLQVVDTVRLSKGVGRVEVTPTAAGLGQIQASMGALTGASNPMVVRAGAQAVYWGDLQIHTGRSDGTGTPEEVWGYARDVAGLDVAAITDHDHWGMRFLDATPALWDEARTMADRFDDPGRFVAVAGYEWTHWLYGHRHVLWFEDDPPLYSSMDPATDTPSKLWEALAGRRVITVAHHSAGGPVAVDWSFRPPPELEPVTEIVSVHGQSEAMETPNRIYDAVPGNFVVDQLRDGLRVGLIGSSDGHDGHPGLGQLNAPTGGLAAIMATELTREAVYEALMARRVYATNGVRTLVRFEGGGQPMGSVLPAGESVELVLRVVGTAPVARIDEVTRAGHRALVQGRGSALVHHTWTLENPAPGELVYIRVFQEDGGIAWSSPLWFE